jgi:zinc protease
MNSMQGGVRQNRTICRNHVKQTEHGKSLFMPEPSTVHKHKLANGLNIHLKEIHTAPIISHWVWYRVGSRNEVPGKTGLSHWVEHMQFKGTPGFPASTLDKAISREGGVWNAFTYLDWTTYFETMPADKIELGLRLEVDRMNNSLFSAEEVEAERTVIISEREGSENEPLFKLSEAVQAASFNSHPYRNEIIGDLADLRSITRDDLYGHYRQNYSPSNALLCMAGDFNAAEMLHRIEDLYSAIPSGEIPPLDVQEEQHLGEERRISIKGHGETTYLLLAYRAPRASSADFFTFSVLDSLLCGPSSLNMFGGGGIFNKTSILYQKLVDTGLATGISGGLQATVDPYLYEITATINPNHTLEEILAVIDTEIEKLQSHKVREEDIHRAIKQARALFAYGSENITNQAFWLGYAEMFATYEWFEKYLDNLEKTTPADIQKLAERYLARGSRVIGSYLPRKGKGAK